MRKIMLHNLLQHKNFIIPNLILLLLLGWHLLTLHTSELLILLLSHPDIITITVICLHYFYLLVSHCTDPVVHLLADLGVQEEILLTAFYLVLDLLLPDYFSFDIILDHLQLLLIKLPLLIQILAHHLFDLFVKLTQKLCIIGL